MRHPILLLALLPSLAGAGEVVDAAEAVLAAVRGGEPTRLSALAGADEPDPWLVADELCFRGEHAAAEAFALAAPRSDTERLADHVRARRNAGESAETRELVARLNDLYRSGKFDEALRLVADPVEPGTLPSTIRLAHGRGVALAMSGQEEEACRQFVATAEAARRIGWKRRAAESTAAAAAAIQGASPARARELFESALALQEERGDRASSALYLRALASLRVGEGKFEDAIGLLTRAVALLEATGDLAELGSDLQTIGTLCVALGDPDRGLPHLRRALALAEAEGQERGIAELWQHISNAEGLRRDWEKSLSAAMRALERFEKFGDKAGAAEALDAVARGLGGLARREEAHAAYEREIALREEIGDVAGAAAALSSLGLLHTTSDPRRALEYYRKAEALSGKAGDPAATADILGGLALAARAAGERPDAEAAYRKALEIRRSLGDLAGEADVLRQLAIVHRDARELERALALCGEAVAVADREDFPGNSRIYSSHHRASARTDALLGRASILRELGRREDALRDAEAALAICSATAEQREMAECCRDLGRILDDLGEYDRAIERFRQCISLAEAVRERVFVNDGRQGIGRIQADRGLYDEAIGLLEAVRDDREKHGDLHGTASVLTDLGSVHRERGDYDRAVECYERARAIAEETKRPLDEAACWNNLAIVHTARGEYAEALALLDRSRALRERLNDEPGVADALNNIANVQVEQGAYDEALENYRRSLAIRERLGLRSAAAGSLSNIAGVLRRRGDIPEALAYYAKARAEMERLGDREGISELLNNLGGLYLDLAEYDRARDCLERALALDRGMGRPAGISACLCNLALLDAARGDNRRALERLDEALSMHESRGELADSAAVLGNRGGLLQTMGDPVAARSDFDRALGIARSIGASDLIATGLVNVGSLEADRGEFPAALAAFREALELKKRYRNRRGEATVLGSIGSALLSLGDFPGALRNYEESLAIRKSLGDRSGVATCEYNVATVYQTLGDDEHAEKYFRSALDVAQKLGEKGRQASAWNALGNVYDERGDAKRARECYSTALALSEETGEPRGISVACANLAHLLERERRFEEANPLHERALETDRRTRNRRAETETLINFADSQRRRGDAGRAEELARAALGIAERIGARKEIFRALWTLSLLRVDRGEFDEALRLARDALVHFRAFAGGLSDEHAAKVRESSLGFFSTAALAAIGAGDTEALLEFLETERAGALLESLGGRSRLRSTALPGAELREEEVSRAALERSLAGYRLALENGTREDVAARKVEMERALDHVEEVIGRIQRDSKAAADLLYPRAARLEELRASLRPGEVMVMLRFFAENLFAVIVDPERASVRKLGGSKEVEQACDAYSSAEDAAGREQAVKSLSALVIGPLALEGARRLLISPQGALCYVPFAAFRQPWEVVHIPSGSTYAVLRRQAESRGEKILALGDPAVGAGRSLLRGPVPGRLPGSADEARAVGDRLLLGAEATETGLSSLLGEAERWRSVHLACHAVVDTEKPLLSSLLLTPDAQSDGLLTMLDVFRMDCPADLVVLSACETARGRLYKTEGVVGFTRAFMFAGAPRVIVSLWKVDDEATKELMIRFYRLWREGKSCAAALREAQLHIASQERWKDPIYWAAWQLWGLGD